MVKTGVKQQWVWLILLAGLWVLQPLLVPRPLPVLLAQTEPTATPDADGFIYIIVQPNDSLWAIAARSGISLTELLDLNNLTESALIQPGDRLIVGIVAPPATAAPEATPTTAATRPPPTPSSTPPPPPLTVICLVAFADNNGNGEREPTEPLQAGVAFTVFTSEGVVANYVTDGLGEPYCLTDLTPGNYQITRSVGRTETLTNSGNRTVFLNSGDQVMLGFGSVVGMTPGPTVPDTAVSPTQPAAIIGNDAAAPLVDLPVTTMESQARRPLLIGAGILIGLLLIGTAVFIGRKRT